MPFSLLKTLKRFPSFSQASECTITIDRIDQEVYDQVLFVYISHFYFERNPNFSNMCQQHPGFIENPDSLIQDLYELCIYGIDNILSYLTENILECYIWIDHSCLNPSFIDDIHLFPLEKIIGCSDLIFTPILDKKWQRRKWPDVYENYFKDYLSSDWRGNKFSYVNGGWSRLEMFLSANLPIVRDSPQRLEKFKRGLYFHRRNGRRPHLLYGSKEKESMKACHPIILFPLQNSIYCKYHPLKGTFATEKEKNVAKLFVTEQLIPFLSEIKVGYKGEVNRLGEPHGKGKEYYPNGEIYSGEWVSGRKNGKGKYIYASGDVYEGTIVDDKIHGKGTMMYSDGRIYEGDFRENLMHGQGCYLYPNGAIFEGEFQFDKEHGYGKLILENGDIYEGEWKLGKKDGRGKMSYLSRKEYYEGEYQNGVKHGFGIYYYSNGNRYEGTYCEGIRNGPGKLILQNGHCFEGEFKDDNLNSPQRWQRKFVLSLSGQIFYNS